MKEDLVARHWLPRPPQDKMYIPFLSLNMCIDILLRCLWTKRLAGTALHQTHFSAPISLVDANLHRRHLELQKSTTHRSKHNIHIINNMYGYEPSVNDAPWLQFVLGGFSLCVSGGNGGMTDRPK